MTYRLAVKILRTQLTSHIAMFNGQKINFFLRHIFTMFFNKLFMVLFIVNMLLGKEIIFLIERAKLFKLTIT
jgi:hypothetical protein